MQGHDYIFCLQDKAFNFWKYDPATRTVIKTSQPYFLDFSPDGWEEVAIQNIRNKQYKAIDRSVTIPLAYVRDGGQILKHIAYTLGVKEKVYLSIAAQKLNYRPLIPGVLTNAGLMDPGTNTGTVTVAAGQTVRVRISISTPDPQDSVIGSIAGTGGNLYTLNINNLSATVVIDVPGTYNYNFFYSTFGVGYATIELVNEAGDNTQGWGFWYKRVYRGQIDWPTFDHKGAKVTVTSLEDGLPKYLKANDKTVYEYPLNEIMVKQDGLTLHQKAEYLVTNGGLLDNNGNHSVELSLMGQEGIDLNIKGVQRMFLGDGNQNQVLAENKLWFYYSSNGDSITVSWDFYLTCDLAIGIPANPFVELFLVARNLEDDGTVIQGTILQQFTTPAFVYRRNHFVGTMEVPVQVNSGLYLFMGINAIGTSGDGAVQFLYDEEGGSFKIDKATYRKAPDYVPAIRPQTLWNLLVNSVSAGEYLGHHCTYFETHKNKVFYSGNALRGLPNPTIKISLEQFFKFWDSVDSVGLIDRVGSVELDREVNLIDLDNLIELPAPASGSLRVNFMKELFFNVLEIGFPEIKNDVGVLNGKEEVNTKTVYSSDSMDTVGKLDKISPVKVSAYEQEGIRVLTTGKPTTDNKNDNEPYALHIEDVLQPADGLIPAHYRIDRTLNPFVTAGLLEPETIYNLWFTPKRSVERNGEHIRGRFYRADNELFHHRSSDKNKDLICDGVNEAASFAIGQLSAPKLVPISLEMEVPPPYTLLELLDLNPLQGFSFPLMGGTFIGTLEKMGIAPARQNIQQIELRGIWTNDYELLIKFYG